MVSTNYLICYDITEDLIRTAVAEVLKGVGLLRIQYSVFYGKLSSSQLREIKLEIEEIIKDSNSNVHFVKVCSACEKDHSVLVSIQFKESSGDGTLQDTSELSDELYEDIRDEIDFDTGVLVI